MKIGFSFFHVRLNGKKSHQKHVFINDMVKFERKKLKQMSKEPNKFSMDKEWLKERLNKSATQKVAKTKKRS